MEFDPARILSTDSPRAEYKPSKEVTLDTAVVKGLHLGQRKLLLSEVEFFSAILERRKIVNEKPILAVYAGAAGGFHLPHLFNLFREIRFVLIDPAPFCEEVCRLAEMDGDEAPILELISDYCTDELCLRLARMYGDRYVIYLISDIRSGAPGKMRRNAEHTEMLLRDNAWQRSWCWSLRAEAALLKFHPPYPAVKDSNASNYDPSDDTPDSVEYLDGYQLLGVWAPKSSSEVRLLAEGPFKPGFIAKTRTYGCLDHEEQCYYYNIHGRYSRDCAAERSILGRYLKLFPQSYPSVEAASASVSVKLRFDVFKPLEPGFTEDHARWAFLLHSTRLPEAAMLFEVLKPHMTIAKVRDLVSQYANSSEVPEGVKVGDTVLDRTFWRVFCRGDFPEAYSFPRIRWTFFRDTVDKRPRA